MATKKKKMKKTAKKSAKTKKRPVKKKVKKAKAKKAKKVMKKKGKKKTTKAKARKVVSKKPAGKKATKQAIKAVKEKMLGKVVHYYDKIGVAIVELASPLSIGDSVTFKRGEHVHSQTVGSMQINHAPIQNAKKGDVVGVQVSAKVPDDAVVIPT